MKAVTTSSIHTNQPVVDVSKPKPSVGEVLIKVHAAGVNHLDLGWISNPELKKHPKILGVEIAGEVVNSNGNEIEVGQRVMALVNNGGYAEFVAVPLERLMVIPDEWSYEVAAGFSESFITAYQTLIWEGELLPDQTVLIHAGASNVGMAATQLAKLEPGVKVITTSSTAKTKVCLANGVDIALDYSKANFAEQVNAVTNGQGVDLVLDFIGASYFNDNLKALKDDGRLILIGTLGGSVVDHVDLRTLMMKRLTVRGTLLSTRSNGYKDDMTSELNQYLEYDLEALKPPMVSRVFPLADVAAAHRYLADKKDVGKVILHL